MYGILAAAQPVILDDSLVAVLADDVQIGFRLGNIDMLLILSVLHEDEPRSAASLRSSVNSCLNGSIVARSVGSNHSVIQFGSRLLALHRGEGNLSLGDSLSAATRQHALRHGEGILSSILQSRIFEHRRLTADDRNYLLAVQSSGACASLHLVVEGQYDRAVGTDTCGIVCRVARHERGHLGSSACSIGEHEDISQHRTVAAILNAHLRRIVVRDEANINPVLVVSLCRQVELAVLPSTVRQLVRAKLSEVRAVDTIFSLHDAIGVVVIAQSSRELQVLITLR